MSVDVDIYMSGIIKFFKNNPKDLLNLVPQNKETEFYNLIRKVAEDNIEKGNDVTLTKKQMIDICKVLNEKKEPSVQIIDKVIVMTPFGNYSLN